jgi:hypothetical protein
MNKLTRLLEYWRLARTARRESGVGVMRQALEMLQLSRAPNCLSPSEYFDHGLAGKQDAAKRFVGWRSPVIQRLQAVGWHALANDKLAYYAHMAGLGFPVPKLFAVFHPGNRLASAPTLTSRQAMADFLRGGCPYPAYGKPVHGLYGLGNSLCVDYRSDTDCVVLGDGTARKVDDYVATIDDRSGLGYLFQEALYPPPEVSHLWGNRLSTIRVVIVLGNAGPETFLCEVKIPTGTNMVDNFADGKSGNFLALLDNDSGEIIRVRAPGLGTTERRDLQHPDTGTPLMGTVIPQWPEVIALAHRAARAFPGLRLQGWDIAHTTHGLLPLELNLVTGRTAYNHQAFLGRGLLTDEVRKLIG